LTAPAFDAIFSASTGRREEVAMPAKPKSKRATKVYDNKLYREFERLNAADPDDPFFREYYFRRRHLAWGWADTGHRRLKYEIEGDRLALLMDYALALIKHRDGEEILKEVSAHLLFELLTSINLRGGLPPSWRRLLKELIADRQAADAEIDAQLKRRGRRGDSGKAIAA
jgi:hypothetical protein